MNQASSAKNVNRQAEAPTPSQGAIYVAIGDRFFREAILSAKSLRRQLPDIPITVYTDSTLSDEGRISQRIPITRSGYRAHRDKLVWMPESPYDRTLFLDTDTYVCGDVSGLFPLLDHFDLAASEEGHLPLPVFCETVPNTVREMNTGVVVFRKSEALAAVFAQALQLYDAFAERPDARQVLGDQDPLRIAFHQSTLRRATLAPEFNCRFAHFHAIEGSVRILHARPRYRPHDEVNLEDICRTLNKATGHRALVGGRVIHLQQFEWFGRHPTARQTANLNGSFAAFVAARFWSVLTGHGLRALLRQLRFKGAKAQPSNS